MSEPLVCAIMLVNGRKAMVRRAVASFRAQSYENKRLLIWDTSRPRFLDWNWNLPDNEHVVEDVAEFTIGKLRNRAADMACKSDDVPEIFVTFDSDDVSSEHRIAEQVALLQASGADCVGYYEAPFWDTRPTMLPPPFDYYGEGSAWLYRDPARKHVLGASMAYWRKTWERRPFDDINHGEDTRFAARCKTVAVSGVSEMVWPLNDAMAPGVYQQGDVREGTDEPRIVCGIHGGNTSGGYDFTKRQQCFTRAPQFDDYCRKVMTLETE